MSWRVIDRLELDSVTCYVVTDGERHLYVEHDSFPRQGVTGTSYWWYMPGENPHINNMAGLTYGGTADVPFGQFLVNVEVYLTMEVL